jgi:hypothetical protein
LPTLALILGTVGVLDIDEVVVVERIVLDPLLEANVEVEERTLEGLVLVCIEETALLMDVEVDVVVLNKGLDTDPLSVPFLI